MSAADGGASRARLGGTHDGRVPSQRVSPVRIAASYDEQADRYFWLRQPVDGSDVDELRIRIASIYVGLPPMAFLMLDPAIAGEPGGPEAVLKAIPHLPSVLGGIPVAASLKGLAKALSEAPPPPPERRSLVEAVLAGLDIAAVERGVEWAAASVDMTCDSRRSLVHHLRAEEGAAPQLWHVPMFVAAAEATRRCIAPGHVDFGETHGYYAKARSEVAELEARGLLAELRRT